MCPQFIQWNIMLGKPDSLPYTYRPDYGPRQPERPATNMKTRPHRSRDRHTRRRPRSRSPAPGGVKRKQNEPMTFKEKLKASFMEVQKKASAGTLNMDDFGGSKLSGSEKPSNLSLQMNPMMIQAMQAAANGGNATPQQALMQTMAAMHQKAQELTGVAVPKYYNPAAVNPLKYAEQVQKRKLLWGKKDKAAAEPAPASTEAPTPSSSSKAPTASAAPSASVAPTDNDHPEAVAFQENDKMAKFKKLMGIKGEETEVGIKGEEAKKHLSKEQLEKQQSLFQNLDQQYEFARMSTHTHRGVGLGFASLYGQFK